jgi:predicted SprT family Zn-dependent metalloprotease
MKPPTVAQTSSYQSLFDFFNARLFNGELPHCVLNFSRAAKSYGFFVADIWSSSGDRAAEISLNPDHLDRKPKESLSTLVHEMCHLWEHAVSKTAPRRCYHNRQFADKMEQVGLMTSSTGEPGGKRVGQKMTHYIIEGGAYEKAFADVTPEMLLPWSTAARLDGDKEKAKRPKSKFLYTCPCCGAKAWGKPGLLLICGECEEEFEMEEEDA